MTLRWKLALLVGTFCLFMIGSVLSATWCIGVYLNASFSDFQRSSFVAQAVEDLRDELRAVEADEAIGPKTLRGWRNSIERLEGAGIRSDAVAALRSTLDELEETVVSGRIADAERIARRSELLFRLEADLHTAGGLLSERRQSAHDRAYAVQEIILAILTANILLGCALVALAFIGVQRWITRPVLRLHQAAEQFSAGRLDYRVPVRSHDELGQLSTQINAMAASLAETQKKLLEQEREAALGELTRAVAHNMRNPLASIRACAQSSVMHLTDDPEATEQCHKIIEIVDQCERWIRNLLQINRPVELALTQTEVEPLIDRVIQASRPFAERRRVRLESRVNGPLRGMIDAELFEQAMAVVVGNAVEASPGGEAVEVAVHAETAPVPSLVVEVSDRGPGVPPELRTKVFEPYFTTKPTGTGLGLHFARRVVRAHHGELTVSDLAGAEHGACFRIRIPLAGGEKEGACPES